MSVDVLCSGSNTDTHLMPYLQCDGRIETGHILNDANCCEHVVTDKVTDMKDFKFSHMHFAIHPIGDIFFFPLTAFLIYFKLL